MQNTEIKNEAENRAANDLDFVLSSFGIPVSRWRWNIFAGCSFLAGVVGFMVWFFEKAPANWESILFLCSLLLTLYGGILWLHTWRFGQAARYVRLYGTNAEEKIVQAAQDLQVEKQASKDALANAEHRHNAEIVDIKAADKELRADMLKDMETRESDAAEKYKQLENTTAAQYQQLQKTSATQCEQLENEKNIVLYQKDELFSKLRGVQSTLGYYESDAKLDVYKGMDALYEGGGLLNAQTNKRKCGGIYIINNAADGKVKIGETGNFSERFDAIRSRCVSSGINGDAIEPVVLVPVDEGRYEIEQKIHAHLNKSRIDKGEWFKITPEEAEAVVLKHVHKRRKRNFKARTKIPVGKK